MCAKAPPLCRSDAMVKLALEAVPSETQKSIRSIGRPSSLTARTLLAPTFTPVFLWPSASGRSLKVAITSRSRSAGSLSHDSVTTTHATLLIVTSSHCSTFRRFEKEFSTALWRCKNQNCMSCKRTVSWLSCCGRSASGSDFRYRFEQAVATPCAPRSERVLPAAEW